MKHLLLLFATIACCCQRVAAVNYSRFCPLQSSEIVPVRRDRYTGTFALVEDYESPLVPPSRNRQLRSGGSEDAIVISTSVSQERDRELSGEVYYVRRCTCAHRAGNAEYQPFCPLEKNNCGVPVSEGEPTQCFNLSTRDSLIQNGWKAVILAYGLLFIYLVLGNKGRNARLYLTGKCCCRPDSHNAEQASDTTTPTEQRPSALTLKTRLYVPPRHVQDDDDAACTICFAPLEEGERVGALACSHQFHTDCLKEWLPRRNTCPLCQATDVATPVYNDEKNKKNKSEQDDIVVHEDEPGEQQEASSEEEEQEETRSNS